MKYSTVRLIPGLILLLSCLAITAWAQTDTFTLDGGNPNNYFNGLYVGPYTGTVTNSSGGTIYSGNVICDDFTDQVNLDDPWAVTAATVGPDGVSGGMFENDVYNYSLDYTSGSTPESTPLTYTGAQAYNAAAYLALELTNPANYNNYAIDTELSYAIWTIFEGTTAFDAVTVGDGVTQAAIVNYIEAAFAATTTGYNGPTVTVFTPSGPGLPGPPGTPGQPQEFLVVTPEPPAWASLMFDFTALLGAILFVRRRILRSRQLESSAKI